ncbi:hypothetical protein [Thermoflexus sp.]|uniref:hypothetical protein n=1 Tax=Thermoflexus sp. TaxID=1969742 RepID=UPI00332429F5
MARIRWYGWAVLVLLSLWLLSLRRPEGGALVVPTPSPAAPAADRGPQHRRPGTWRSPTSGFTRMGCVSRATA